MSGYLGTKAVLLSTTSATVGGDSTVGGDLTVDTNTLYVDSTNNRVGIGTSSPTSELTIGSDTPQIDLYKTSSADVLANIRAETDAGSGGKLVFQTKRNGDSALDRMTIDDDGNLLVGTTSSSANVVQSDNTSGYSYQVAAGINSGVGIASTAKNDYASQLNRQGNTDGGIVAFRRNGTIVGTISVTTSATAYNTSSDHRLKENVTDVTDGIIRVKQLEPKRFNFIADPDRTVDGFLAHQAQAVVPEAVTGTHNEVDDDGNAVMQGIDQSKLVPLLTAALKEAITKIETLETEMTSVKARLDALEGN